MISRKEVIELLQVLNITPYEDSYDVLRSLRAKCGDDTKIKIGEGASKICLIFPDAPFVVKWSTGDYAEAMKEVEIYKKATEKNLEKFFPKTAFLTTINNVDFVVQEKIDFSAREIKISDSKKFDRISRTALDRIVAKMNKEFQKASPICRRGLDERWAKMALVLYGKKACKALCEFIIENKINDLHKSNIGYKNGKPIILDFSGYDR